MRKSCVLRRGFSDLARGLLNPIATTHTWGRMMTRFNQTTNMPFLLLAALVAMGCDSVALDATEATPSGERFQTVAPNEGEAATLETGATADGSAAASAESMDELAHTALTQLDAPHEEPGNTSFAPAAEAEPVEDVLPEEAPHEEVLAEVGAEEEVPVADIFEHASEPILWTPSGTYKLPSYGAGCRLTTDDVIQIPSNGLKDDSLVFSVTNAAEALLSLTVQTPTGQSLNASVDLKRGLTGRSYRQAMGEALWSDKEGEHVGLVVDGTLCFDEKLSAGLDDVLAEFSLIVEIEGDYYAMGGNVLIEGSQVEALNGFSIDGAGAVDIDLR